MNIDIIYCEGKGYYFSIMCKNNMELQKKNYK